ncbi:GumC family protein [Salegentibacter salarius]|uniref:non-specific protein-tyrosine kinase n=1 Tax=Salegentibacter salarius TaxID=435906 RepID=A0A2N0TRU1_9FLAO|nr:tyrosine-protein kinase family protein [Salegentibacter salarius]OEY71869.1 tyrosine protein kinase [Salegentibacter salarius]PKD17462.1 tyrosine protein kinase [Salegentibacter salarius]SLK04720.1 capsular exopolysaccharide family [Salegentibacter salarius]
MSQQSNTHISSQGEGIDLREEIDKYLRFWPWFIIGVVFCITVALVYIKYTTAKYSTTASVIIKDEEGKGPSSEMAAFADLGLLGGMGASSIENEIGILRSKTLMTQTIEALNLNITYFEEKTLGSEELYNEIPFKVIFLKLEEEKLQDAIKNDLGNAYFINPGSGKNFQLINTETNKVSKGEFGTPMDIDFATIIIKRTNLTQGNAGKITVRFSPVEDVVAKYREEVQIYLIDKNSSLLELSLIDPVKKKAQDILDQLVLEYNQQAIEDKNLVATNTAKFIDERLAIINQELDSVEVGKEEFKKANQLTNIEAESEMFIENASDYKKRQQEVGTQLELANAMITYLETGGNSDLLPANLGIQETGVNELIGEYNTLVLERNRILSGSTEENPVVLRLNSQVEQMRNNVMQSLERMRNNFRIAQKDLDRQAAIIGSQISSVPSKERKYRGIERQQNIKEALYLFLLEKREENSLSLAVTAPKAKIVDSAYSASEPVSPKSKIILLGSLILGLLIPFLIIYLKNILNNKLKSRDDLEKLAGEIPIVGEIPRVEKKNSEMVLKNDRSILAEAFRILHTNLQYLLVNSTEKEGGNTIFVTSTVKGEGKTLVSFNLAVTLANTNKKVLIVGADLRNPQLQRFEKDARAHIGVSDYLANDGLKLKDLIRESNTDNSNLELLPSGTIPPNPSELWRRQKTGEMFKELEQMYDYVIVDTAPSLLVTDTFLINKWADIILYVTRAGHTEKKLLQFAVDAKKEGKFHDLSFVLNDVKWANFGYGNKYGYAYGEEKKSFFKRLLGKAAVY